jgi:hypothetical protein
MADNPKTKRRWLKIFVQTLLVVLAVLGGPLLWVAWKMEEKRQERTVVAEIERLGGHVFYDWQMARLQEVNSLPRSGEPTGPTWLRWLLGDDFLSHVAYVGLPPSERSPVNDDDLRRVATFSNLEDLDLSYTGIEDAKLVYLQGFAHLRSLNLSETKVTDAGLRHLKSLTTLKFLLLYGTKTTSAAVNDLAKSLPECEISEQ